MNGDEISRVFGVAVRDDEILTVSRYVGSYFRVCDAIDICSIEDPVNPALVPLQLVANKAPDLGCQTYKTISLLAHKHLAFLHPPYPHRQRAIDDEVRNDRPQRCRLGSVPPKLVVCVEGYCGDGDGGVTERQADVG